MSEVKTETYTGASATGVIGAVNRVLTLSNTGTTSGDGFLVHASGVALALTSEYTVVHASTGTAITFLKKLWDDQTIIVNYHQERTAVVTAGGENYQKMRADFQGIITEHGISATLIRQAETTDSVGGVTAVSESSYTIYVMIQDITKKDRQIHEMGLAIPGNSKAFLYHEYPDSITGNGNVTPKVGDIIVDSASKRWRIEQMIAERYADQNEIFKVAIIKKIDLDE